MGFRTKLDYSDNRQIRQRERTFTNLSGGTVFGVPFSGLTTGVDPTNSGITETYTSVISTFSGNATTTIFTWYDSRMDIANSSISAITSSNSGITQNTGNVFVISSTGTTADGYNINLEYTGTTFDLTVGAIFSGAGPVYSGTVIHEEIDFLSASTLDYKGRTIWIDNPEITRTNRLIVSNNPQTGYVLTCFNTEGEAVWQSVSGATSGVTFWEEAGVGNTALRDEKGSHTINGTSDNSIIAGGLSNTIDSTIWGFVGGGTGLELYGSLTSSLLGGANNSISGNSRYASIIGGASNEINDTSGYSSIIGGYNNLINDVSQYSSIVGGKDNTTTGNYSGIVGGQQNTSTGINSGIVSGYGNTSTAANSFIAGGFGNIITGSTFRNAIIGGQNNVNYGDDCVIVGGENNTVSFGSNRNVILGGQGITATADDTVYMNNLYVTQGTDGVLYSDMDNSAGAVVILSGSSKLVRHQISVGTGGAGTGAGGSIGLRAWDDVTYTPYGQPGDMHIYAGITSNGLNIISADGGGASSGADYIRFYAGQDASGTSDMHIQGTGITQGYVGIATESPTQQLDVNGNGRFRNIGSSASAGALHYDATGVLTTNTSDERMKDEIITIDSALEKIKQLRGVYYKWKEDIDRGVTDNTRIGFIAQEVEKIVPELTFRNERTEDKLMGVHYQDVTALLVEAIKELIDSGVTNISKEELIFETQTIASEDNNIELNYGGTHASSLDGGLTVVKGIDENNDATLMIDSSGDWTTNTHFKPNGLVIPEFTPTSSLDENGKLGEVTRDDEYLYIKTKNGWRRTGLETF